MEQAMSDKTQREKLPALTVSVNEAADLLGVSPDTVRRLIADGGEDGLPAFRAGRGKVKSKVLIRRAALDAFIEKRELAGV